MSAIGKLLFAIIIITAAGLLVWKSGWVNLGMPQQPVADNSLATTTPTTTTPKSDLPTDTADASDGAIAQDTAAIDVQMQGLSSDSANVGTSMSDTPIAQ